LVTVQSNLLSKVANEKKICFMYMATSSSLPLNSLKYTVRESAEVEAKDG